MSRFLCYVTVIDSYFNRVQKDMRWALALCLPGVISAWLAPAAPPARFMHQRRVFALAFAPRMSAGPGEERQSGAKKLSPLIASLVEEEPQPTLRMPMSASDMAQLSADAKAAATPESLAGQRRNFLLALASPIVGAAAFSSSRSRVGDTPTDPLAILQAMERKSPTIQAALQSTRPTLVEFYGRNCPNCRAMAPDMNKLETQFHDRVNFVVLDAEKPEYASIVNLFKVFLCVRPCLRRARVFLQVCACMEYAECV